MGEQLHEGTVHGINHPVTFGRMRHPSGRSRVRREKGPCFCIPIVFAVMLISAATATGATCYARASDLSPFSHPAMIESVHHLSLSGSVVQRDGARSPE